MRNHRILLLFILLLPPVLLCSHDIHGKVIDKSGVPVIGAYIIHLTSENHAHTNELGFFSLNGVEEGDTLLITHIGFQSLKYVVEQQGGEVEIVLKRQVFQLDEIVVGQNVKSLNLISNIDIRTDPVNSSQEILQKVPGLFIGQHAGGGKAEQIFLRGFDIDHGTDIGITVDGLPVNMISHAHGQGYADLHFLIPETVENFDFGKGPYYADKGNFTTAGYVNFVTKERLENSSVQFDLGRFNTQRVVGLFDIISSDRNSAYLATEFISTDGAFESPQNFNRLNLMGKYTVKLSGQNQISLMASHFSSQWDASGQIPERSVEDGTISRFGAIDDTEGGITNRTNIAFTYNKALDVNTFVKNRFYYTLYDFELYSNFTFFLRDPIRGDQIRQREKRQIYGFESEWNRTMYLGNTAALIQGGIGVRHDDIDDNELSATANRRETLERFSFGQVTETNLFGYGSIEFDFGDLLFNAGLRFDHFNFNYLDDLATAYQPLSETKSILSPKLNLIYNINSSLQLFAKGGLGFHSNDTRVVVAEQGETILPAAYGTDLGFVWKPAKRLILNSALWYLFLEQEFVYVGDEGIVEPSGKTRRLGADLGIRYQIADWLFFDSDLTYAYARSIDEPGDAQYIPLAPNFTYTGGFSFIHEKFSGGLQCRFLNDRAANEDNSITADGYFITDLNFNYNLNKITLGVAIENLFDSEWNETQFATTSRLIDEPFSVDEIHFTPGIPFFIKGILKYTF